MTKKIASSNDIRGQITAVDARVIELELEAEGLALAVVSGDTDAVARMSAIRAEIERAKADKIMFERAFSGAVAHEAAERAKEKQAAESVSAAAARKQAARIVEIADRVDAMVEEFRALMGELIRTEVNACSNVAKGGLSQAVTANRRGLFLHSAACFDDWRTPEGRRRARVGELARKAWCDIAEGTDA
jgi:type III secretion system FlhB-like substrate exporter